MAYKANDKYSTSLGSGYTASPPDTTLSVGSVPANLPTIVTAAKGTDEETIFAVTGSSGGNTLTGVTRLRGANVDLPQGTSIECLNNEEFVNQYSSAVFTQNNLNDLVYAADGGSTDAYVITLPVTPSAYADLIGLPIQVKANTANTGDATININSLGVKNIKKFGTAGIQALSDNDIQANQIVSIVYDGTQFLLLGGSGSGGTAFWSGVSGTPTRVSDTQFTITDSANANKYDLLFKKGTVLKWEESGTFQQAMVISSSYAANVVTVNIVGNSLSVGFTNMKYAIPLAIEKEFLIPGNLIVASDQARPYYMDYPGFIVSVDARVTTPGTTNPTVFDVNDDGTTIITTKPSVASGASSDLDNVTDMALIAADSKITIDIDSVSTTAPIEAYIKLWIIPESWRYRS